MEMLGMVFGRMAHVNIRLKLSKCSTSVQFLGHIFDEHGMHLSDKTVRDSRYPIPTSVSAIRSFVGMVNYFRLHSKLVLISWTPY